MLTLLAALAALQAPAAAPVSDPASVPAETPEDWHTIADDEVMVMTLAGGQRVVIRLAPRYAPVHVANIRRLAGAGWWDGLSINRVQDNYVVQWGDASEAKPLPRAVEAMPPAEYQWPLFDAVAVLSRRDPYAIAAGFSAAGWPLATDGAQAWIPHCYGMVGVGRNLAPDVGTGAELCAVIGHGPRHLDRNIAVVGRVLEGMEALSSLPRGTAPLGFYAEPAQRIPIRSVRMASDLPEAERPRFQIRATARPSFRAYIAERENREPPFFTVPAGGADICNVPVPVRPLPR